MNAYGELIRLLIAAACALFVLSLPLSKTETGATLRRWAGVCFILAFLPSLVVGLFYPPTSADAAAPVSAAGGASTSPAQDFLSGLGCIAALVLACLLAYGILKLRSRFASKAKPRDTWETFFNRGGGKRPFTMNPNSRRTRAPFSFDMDNDGEDED